MRNRANTLNQPDRVMPFNVCAIYYGMETEVNDTTQARRACLRHSVLEMKPLGAGSADQKTPSIEINNRESLEDSFRLICSILTGGTPALPAMAMRKTGSQTVN